MFLLDKNGSSYTQCISFRITPTLQQRLTNVFVVITHWTDAITCPVTLNFWHRQRSFTTCLFPSLAGIRRIVYALTEMPTPVFNVTNLLFIFVTWKHDQRYQDLKLSIHQDWFVDLEWSIKTHNTQAGFNSSYGVHCHSNLTVSRTKLDL